VIDSLPPPPYSISLPLLTIQKSEDVPRVEKRQYVGGEGVRGRRRGRMSRK